MKFFIVVFSALFLAVNSLPAGLYSGIGMAGRPKRQHGMAFTGFYSNVNNEQDPTNYNYEQSPVAPESPLPIDQLANVEGSTQINEIVPQVPQEAVTDKVNTKKTPEPDSDEDEEDDSSWPLFMGKAKGRQPSFSFFPIMFGGAGLGRSGGAPDGAVAIANSFSTGKKGIAMSNAVANGDPTSFMRNGNRADYRQD